MPTEEQVTDPTWWRENALKALRQSNSMMKDAEMLAPSDIKNRFLIQANAAAIQANLRMLQAVYHKLDQLAADSKRLDYLDGMAFPGHAGREWSFSSLGSETLRDALDRWME